MPFHFLLPQTKVGLNTQHHFYKDKFDKTEKFKFDLINKNYEMVE
jgi:hypothetical protein